VTDGSMPENDETSRAADLASIVEPLPFHRAIVEFLEAREGELWKWFSSTAFLDEYAATTRLELLKSCYRFDQADHAELHALVDQVRERLGIAAPVTLYQSQSSSGMNASLCYVPREVHLVLEGPIRATLSTEELRSIVAHELAHFLLWERQEGALLVADQMLSAMAAHARSEPSHFESARLFRLYLEVHCDRAALAVSPDPLIAISALIKVQTGLVDAQAESYLRQSDEIFGQAQVKTEGITHPEAFIRARALKLWADGGRAAAPEISRMIEGPLDLGRLSLIGQQRLTELTRRVLLRFLEPTWLRTEALVAHARLFFPDLNPEEPGGFETGAIREELTGVADSVRDYLCYVLLDLATVEPRLEQAPLAAAVGLAEDLGIADAFLAKAGDELDLGKRALLRLRRECAKVVADAAAAEPSES
jgi:hypothetical protein